MTQAPSITEFLTARYDEDEAVGDPHAVWQLDHDGYGRTLHATAGHAKAEAERREPDGDTYWRWDDGKYWFKRHGETIATIERAPVLGHDPARTLADIAAKRAIVAACAHWGARSKYVGNVDRNQLVDLARGVLRYLAAPYADHEDFDAALRP